MADTKLTALSANATPAFEDLLYTVDDPSGTPISKKITLAQVRDLMGIFVRKTGDESVTTSAAMQDDDHLTVTLDASATYLIQYGFYYSASLAGDFKWQWVGPSDLVGKHGAMRLSNSATSSEGNIRASGGAFTSGTSSVLSAGGTTGTAYVQGDALVVTTTGGAFKLQWAQETSDGTATQLLTYSWMLARRLA
jgi:hypothetical protein